MPDAGNDFQDALRHASGRIMIIAVLGVRHAAFVLGRRY